MLVRIRWKRSVQNERGVRNRTAALLLASLSAPAAVLAFTMAIWDIAAHLRWTNSFAISSGIFSHWQVWLAAAALLLISVSVLDRYGRGGGETI
jgi:hypothetical protein